MKQLGIIYRYILFLKLVKNDLASLQLSLHNLSNQIHHLFIKSFKNMLIR